MEGRLTILLAVHLYLRIDEDMTDWLPLAPAPSFSIASSTSNSGWRGDSAWDYGGTGWEAGAATDASISTYDRGLGKKLCCSTNSSIEGWMSGISHLVCSSTCCDGCGQEIEQVSWDPKHRERNAATSRANDEANLSILSVVSMTHASSTSVASSQVEDVEAIDGAWKWIVLSGCSWVWVHVVGTWSFLLRRMVAMSRLR